LVGILPLLEKSKDIFPTPKNEAPENISTEPNDGIKNPSSSESNRKNIKQRDKEITISYVLEQLECDILCLQETKLSRRKLTESLAILPHYESYYSFYHGHSQRSSMMGYSGVAVYVSKTTLPVAAAQNVVYSEFNPNCHGEKCIVESVPEPFSDISWKKLDSEGRIMMLDVVHFVLINVYCPNGTEDRWEFKVAFHEMLLYAIRKLIVVDQREVILLGDLNVTHREIDHADPFANLKKQDIELKKKYTQEELRIQFQQNPIRLWMDDLLNLGMIDAFRYFHPNQSDAYTCWNVLTDARRGNFGSRIDYILVSEGLKSYLLKCDILDQVLGSDHCPVMLELSEFPNSNMVRPKLPKLCSSNLPEFALPQPKISNWVTSPQLAEQRPRATADAQSPSKRKMSQPQIQIGKKRKETPVQLNLNQFFSKSKRFGLPAPSCGVPHAAKINTSNDIQETSAINQDALVDNAVEIDTKKAWKSIFSPTAPPTCSHGEACVSFVVNKKGPNNGRKFWICNRPVGPKSNLLSEFRCNFFVVGTFLYVLPLVVFVTR
jgi:AP endonuclease-2